MSFNLDNSKKNEINNSLPQYFDDMGHIKSIVKMHNKSFRYHKIGNVNSSGEYTPAELPTGKIYKLGTKYQGWGMPKLFDSIEGAIAEVKRKKVHNLKEAYIRAIEVVEKYKKELAEYPEDYI